MHTYIRTLFWKSTAVTAKNSQLGGEKCSWRWNGSGLLTSTLTFEPKSCKMLFSHSLLELHSLCSWTFLLTVTFQSSKLNSPTDCFPQRPLCCASLFRSARGIRWCPDRWKSLPRRALIECLGEWARYTLWSFSGFHLLAVQKKPIKITPGNTWQHYTASDP